MFITTSSLQAKRSLNGPGLSYQYPSGSVYRGDFDHGKFHGHGRFEYQPSGDVYEGEWSNDAKHGRGVYTYADGTKYDGEWHEGKMHGTGTAVFASGEEFSGSWRGDKIHGRGVFKNLHTGDVVESEWYDVDPFNCPARPPVKTPEHHTLPVVEDTSALLPGAVRDQEALKRDDLTDRESCAWKMLLKAITEHRIAIISAESNQQHQQRIGVVCGKEIVGRSEVLEHEPSGDIAASCGAQVGCQCNQSPSGSDDATRAVRACWAGGS
jgi:hypothetical protein